MIHQRHRRTDGQTTCDSKTARCTVVHRVVKMCLSVCTACLPVWVQHPRELSVTSVAESKTLTACQERCLRSDRCIGVDVVRRHNNDSNDDDDERSYHCLYHNSHQPMTTLPRHATRYQLLDRCYTGPLKIFLYTGNQKQEIPK